MLLENEIFNLKNLITAQNSSTIAVFGGSQISSKLNFLEFYLENVTNVGGGGAMANTFLKAMESPIGASLYEKSMLKVAKGLIENYSDKILLPEDFIVEMKSKKIEVKPLDKIEKNDVIFDIGPKTRLNFIMKL